jgi:hypothetical protein
MATRNPDFSVPRNWRKSRHSGQDNACVEVANSGPARVMVRDTTDRGGPVRSYDAAAWRQFTTKIANGWQPAS